MELPHLGNLSTSATVALLTGDPDRITTMVDELGPMTGEWRNRGYVCCEVRSEWGRLLLCSTGIGGPSTAIVVEELGRLRVSTFVRVGTCGSLQPAVRAGDIVISCGSVRDDGTSGQYLAPEFPAVPSFDLVRAMVKSAEAANAAHHVGVTHCKDAYYGEKAAGFPRAEWWHKRWTELRACGVLATEMEAAALFAVTTVRAWSSAALFVAVDGSLAPSARLAAIRTPTRIAARAARVTVARISARDR